ncbi:hypothetical protein ACHAWF_008420 [Thalassiosira exigua]
MAPEPLRRRQQQQQQQQERPDPPPPPSPSPSHRGFGSGDLERRSHMAFDELRRRQRDIARLRARGSGGGGTGATGRGKGGRKFGLLLPRIAAPSSSSGGGGGGGRGGSRGRCAALCLASIPLALWLLRSTGRVGGGGGRGGGGPGSVLTKADRASVRHKYWKGDVEEHKGDGRSDGVEDRGQVLSELSKSSRPFKFLGDLDPREAKPWSEDEKDWWSLHETLAKDVKASDAAPPSEFDVDASRLPQLVFYGDSIAEGWRGTSFGKAPGKHRMWTKGEDEEIRRVFLDAFGERSEWGERALKPPLVLGISGSNTRDFLWRVRNGEFPTSRLLDDDDGDAEAKGEKEANAEKEDEAEDENKQIGGKEEPIDDFVAATFQLERLERIYVVLIGTNNLGGGMLPGPTVEGMDAAGRALLELHRTTFPGVPSAMLFSELLPRRDDFRARRMCPPRCKNETTSEPYRSFLPAIEKVNRALPEVVDGWRKDYENARIVLLSGSPEEEGGKGEGEDDPVVAEGKELEEDYVETVRCGRDMFAAEDADEFDVLMPDRLHPNARGYEVWSRCIKRGLEAVMEGSVKLVEEEES